MADDGRQGKLATRAAPTRGASGNPLRAMASGAQQSLAAMPKTWLEQALAAWEQTATWSGWTN